MIVNRLLSAESARVPTAQPPMAQDEWQNSETVGKTYLCPGSRPVEQ